MQDLHYSEYSQRLLQPLQKQDWEPVSRLGIDLQGAWREGRQVFLCGNVRWLVENGRGN